MKRSRSLSKTMRHLTVLHILNCGDEFGPVLIQKSGFEDLTIPTLTELEKLKDVSYIRKKSPSLSQSPLKYYSITERGKETLHTLTEQWIIYQIELEFVLDAICNNSEDHLKSRGMVSGLQSKDTSTMIVLQSLQYNGPTFPYQVGVMLSRFQTSALQSFAPDGIMRILFLEGFVEPVPKSQMVYIQERNKRRKYWKITDLGVLHLNELKHNWENEKNHVNSVLHTK